MRAAVPFLLLALGAAGPGARAGSTPQSPAPVVRFHHAHYRVGDPSVAMAEAAQKLEGVRVIVQGLGVGVRAGREFLLFDRAPVANSRLRGRPFIDAYPLALSRLKTWGVVADPPVSSHLRVASTMGDLPVEHLAFVATDFDAVVQRIAAAGAKVATRRDDAVLFGVAGEPGIEIVRETDREETFWCPMHPDVRSPDPGKCPVCGMALVPIPPPKIGEYKLDVAQLRDPGGRVTGLDLAVHEPDTDALVTKFALVHEKRLHLFVVGRDLRYFAHVHPEPSGDRFTLATSLPPGEYMLIADFLPEGGTSQMIQKAIIVSGDAVDINPRDQANGLKVTMRVDGELVAGRPAKLTFHVSDSSTGAAVTDLEPYLGAPAHMLIVRTDLRDAIHAHPEEQAALGPTVSFHPLIPAPGGYKLWVQFQRAGRVSTTAFELTIPR